MTVVRGRTMVAGPWTTQRPLLVLRYVIFVLVLAMSALSHTCWRCASGNADIARTVGSDALTGAQGFAQLFAQGVDLGAKPGHLDTQVGRHLFEWCAEVDRLLALEDPMDRVC